MVINCFYARRYLVKRSLDGYKPLQVRQNNATTGKPKPSAGMVAQEEKRKRSVLKRLDSDQLDSDSAYSEDLDYMTDDSAERTSHSRATKVVRITSAAQLKELGGADLQTLAVSLLHSSLRTKPRKPLNPTVTALF
ncbi:hypothetical protein N2152v2_005790 [Parachlorella kessleri]